MCVCVIACGIQVWYVQRAWQHQIDDGLFIPAIHWHRQCWMNAMICVFTQPPFQLTSGMHRDESAALVSLTPAVSLSYSYHNTQFNLTFYPISMSPPPPLPPSPLNT